MSEFFAVLQIMSRRTGFRGDREKDPILATSHGGSSSDDETTSSNERVAQVLQSRFDHKNDNTKPASSISMETHSRGVVQLRQPASPLSPVLFLVGLPHSAS